jgi:hypothetical protein
MTTTTPTRDFVEGFAQLLAAASIGLSWDPALSYTGEQTGIFIASMPPTPARCVVLTPYPIAASPTMSDSTEGLQIRTRSAAADVRDVWALNDAINNYLLGLFPIVLPNGVHVSSLMWTSGGSLGQEPSGARRWEWSSNYTATVWRPSLHRQ